MTRKQFMDDVMSPDAEGRVPSMEGYILGREPGQQCEKYENYSKEDLVKDFKDRGGSFITAKEIDERGSFPIGTKFIVHSPADQDTGYFDHLEEVALTGYTDMELGILESCTRDLKGYLMERESLSIKENQDV